MEVGLELHPPKQQMKTEALQQIWHCTNQFKSQCMLLHNIGSSACSVPLVIAPCLPSPLIRQPPQGEIGGGLHRHLQWVWLVGMTWEVYAVAVQLVLLYELESRALMNQ